MVDLYSQISEKTFTAQGSSFVIDRITSARAWAALFANKPQESGIKRRRRGCHSRPPFRPVSLLQQSPATFLFLDLLTSALCNSHVSRTRRTMELSAALFCWDRDQTKGDARHKSEPLEPSRDKQYQWQANDVCPILDTFEKKEPSN